MDAILTALLLAAASPVVVYVVGFITEAAQKRRALARVLGDPLVHEGARIRYLACQGRDAPILRDCVISRIALGMVEIRTEDGLSAMTFTVMEFERLDPIFAIE